MGTIALNEKQQRRSDVLTRVLAGSIGRAEGEYLLGVSSRQMRRLISRYEGEGVISLVHGNTGRAPANKLPESTVRKIEEMCGEEGKYHGFNTCHTRDLLEDVECVRVARSTLYGCLRNAGIVQPRKQTRQTRRKRRERCSAQGMMLQVDGSPHDWLEGRGPQMSMIGAVDDAEGILVYGQFRPTEDQAGYLMMLRSIALNYGLPEMVYHDRHTILRSPKKATIEDELAGKQPESQVQRVMRELGIQSIPAGSPEAKGRIERVWGTLQDRLVKEMRLANICTIDEANAFLERFIPSYNERFGRRAANPESAWVSLEPNTDIAYYFSTSETRTVKADNTIVWFGKHLQLILPATHRRLEGKKIDVHLTPEGDVYLYDGKTRLQYKPVSTRPQQQPQVKEAAATKAPDAHAAARKRGWLYGKQPSAGGML